MRFFTKNRSSKKRIIEEWVYERVADELEVGEIRKGLWTKAKGLSEGDSNKCESIYIQLRAESIVDEARVVNEALDIQEKKQRTFKKHGNDQNTQKMTVTTRDLQNLLEERFCSVDFNAIEISDFSLILSDFEVNLRKQIINTEDLTGNYLIHHTVKHNRLDCTEYLIFEGADISVKNYWDLTPLDIAERDERVELTALLSKIEATG